MSDHFTGFHGVPHLPSRDDEIDIARQLIRVSRWAAPEFVVPPEPWMDEALCTQFDADMFYPDRGSSGRDAKRVCKACPVVNECLAYALENNEIEGVWGAMTPRERRRLRRGAA